GERANQQAGDEEQRLLKRQTQQRQQGSSKVERAPPEQCLIWQQIGVDIPPPQGVQGASSAQEQIYPGGAPATCGTARGGLAHVAPTLPRAECARPAPAPWPAPRR